MEVMSEHLYCPVSRTERVHFSRHAHMLLSVEYSNPMNGAMILKVSYVPCQAMYVKCEYWKVKNHKHYLSAALSSQLVMNNCQF